LTASWVDAGAVNVKMRTLDALVSETPVDCPLALVKLDVEGAEPDVLDGAQRTLKRHRAPIFCEFNDYVLRDRGTSSTNLLNTFRAMGYEPALRYRVVAEQLDDAVVDLLMVSTT
jgi:hypothetical protein